MSTILILALGATLGACARYYLSLWALNQFGPAFPYGTLIINVSGSFVLGFFVTLTALRPEISRELRLLIATGFCGSYTTFSTFSVETMTLITGSNYLGAVLNAFGSLAFGLLGVVLGSILARAIIH